MAVTKGIRDLKKEKYWQEIVEKQKDSGKSRIQFCKDEGLSSDNFYYWKNTLEKRNKVKNQEQPLEKKAIIPFVPLNIQGDFDLSGRQNTADQIEISKIVLRISANTDRSTLACILQSLENG
jgi:hypothetical protein